MIRTLSLGLAAMLLATPVLAQTATPAAPAAAAPATATMALSSILSKIEAEQGFLRFDDIEWDNRDSRWDIDYLGTGGRKVSVTIDAKTGEPVID